MLIDDFVKTALSGEYSRRRGYLTNVLTGWNRLGLTGTLAIWAFVIDWQGAISSNPAAQELFATQIALAGTLCSILLGICCLYSFRIDAGIIRLYPLLYFSERCILPDQLHSIQPPKRQTSSIPPLTREVIIRDEIIFLPVKYRDFGLRGNGIYLLLCAILIFAFATISVTIGLTLQVIILSTSGTPHLIGLLLLGNALGLGFIGYGWYSWRKEELNWPTPNAKPD